MSLMPGNMVTHPLFPEWGKGVITEIMFDTQTGKAIAKVLWEKPKAIVHHTLSHLRHFVDDPVENTPEQLTLKWD